MTDPELTARAAAAGVATWYLDWAGQRVEVDADVVAAVLTELDGTTARRTRPVSPPAGLPLPPQVWGWSVQLYALHSRSSWGMGDLGDLRDLARRSALELGADLVLVNPLHAVAPVHPITASPYSPTSRRFVNPLYLRIEDLPVYAAAADEVRAQVDLLRLPPPDVAGLIDRDAVWEAKSAALQILWPLVEHVDPEGDLGDFATFCALARAHGLPWQDWPAELHDPTSAEVAAARLGLADEVAFHAWLQQLCDDQLAAAQQAAVDAGMTIGIVHDLAVGVDPGGADSWALQDVLATTVTVGAPPDSFNQRGQDWALPPWRPDALARSDFAAYTAMLDAVLGRGGGLRVDHVMGLSRLWWIPPGRGAEQGTYVSYDQDVMLDLLVAAAGRTGGLVVGEDLGTVEPSMRSALAERGVLGSAVLWFERTDDEPDGKPKRPAAWRESAMASITTHDLPTAHGFLTAEAVRVRAELGQLSRSLADERAQAAADRADLLAALTAQGLLDPVESDPDVITLAMHRYLARTRSRVLLAAPYDVLGEVRQPNLPGTTDEYPNWRIPLPVDLDRLLSDPRTAATAEAFRDRPAP